MRTRLALSCAVLLALLAPVHARAASEADEAIQKSLRGLVNAIKYGKDDTAAQKVAFAAMGQALLTEDWAKFSTAEQAEIGRGLETIVRSLSFKKGREMFQYLDALLFEPARIEGERAKAKSTIVVHRDLKKAEIIIDWVLVKDGGAWKVLDTIMLGESTLASLRDEQVKPLLKQGGTAAVMKALRDKVAEVKKP